MSRTEELYKISEDIIKEFYEESEKIELLIYTEELIKRLTKTIFTTNERTPGSSFD